MKLYPRSFWLFMFLLCGRVDSMRAQAVHIGGVINSYAAVSSINFCDNKVLVDNTTGFAVGQEVLMIQMSGAEIVTTNNPSFGDITDYRGSGNYEVNVILSITGNEIVFTYAIKRNYEASGLVQLVSLPHYATAIVDSALKPKPWDGSSGGVILLQADTLILNDSISVKGKGFRGAAATNDAACFNGGVGGATSYTCPTSDCGALKGEGIANMGQPFGRGKNGNAGGGGDDHNTGGGGGSNYGAGGKGGTRNGASNFSCPGPAPGEGGGVLIYTNTNNKIFMGGGGGAGDENNSQGTGGANGGGIVIIMADVVVGNNKQIKAGGDSVTVKAKSDGAGGGGAGGTVLLFVNSFIGNLTVDVVGGRGGNLNNGNDPDFCFGPGGGAGGGALWLKGASMPGNISLVDTGGLPGRQTYLSATSFCPYGSVNGALRGNSGGAVYNLLVPYADVPFIKLTADACCDTTVCPNSPVNLVATGTATYPPTFLWNNGNANSSFTENVAATTDYTVTVTDNRGCLYFETIHVTVYNALPLITVCCDTVLCTGGTVSFAIAPPLPSGLTYLWSTGQTTTSITQNISSSQTFTVTATDINGCTVSKSGTATVNNTPPPLTACCDTTVCAGANVSFAASSTQNLTYSWSTGQNTAGITVPINATQTIFVVGTDTNGCTASNIINVTVNNNPPPFTVCCDTSVCNGAPVIFQAASAQNLSYEWNTGQTTAGVTTNINVDQTFIVTATDANGCTGSQTVSAMVNNNPPAFSVCCDTAVCAGASIATSVSSALNLSYLWSTGQSTLTVTNQISSPQQITVTATDVNGCTGSLAVVVGVNNNSPLAIACCDTLVCSGNTVSLSVASTAGATFNWSTGETTASITPSITNSQNVTVTVTDVNSCTVEASVYVDVPSVQTNITAVPDTSILLGQSVQLTASGSSYFYAWSPADGLSASNIKNPVATPQTTTTYCVTATDHHNCTASDCYTIELLLPDVKIPDAFTPNGDGNNEVLQLFPLKFAEIIEVRIYNRWGELVFFSKGNAAWDGTYKGSAQPNGTYVCSVLYGSSLTPGKTNTIAKDIILIR